MTLMVGRCLTVLLCLLTVGGICVSLGCSNYLSVEKERRRAYVVRTDWNHAGDDLDWSLGLSNPNIGFEDSFPPNP
jgi:hypothetical protein